MQDRMEDEQTVQVMDDWTAPTILVDGIHGARVRDGVLSMNFTSHVFPAPKSGEEPADVVVARLAMPLQAFEKMYTWMTDARASFIDAGLISPADKTDGENGE